MSDNKSYDQKPDKGYRVVRLVNGERLVAKISGRTKSKKIVLDRPMTIKGMINSNPLGGLTKEYLILTDWMDHCSDNSVNVPENFILTISSPDDFLVEAYEAQKEYLDTGECTDPRLEDVNDIGNATLKDLLEEAANFDEDRPEDFSKEGLSSFLSDFLSSIIGNAADKLEEDWSEENLDKDRDDFGNDWGDWSPYLDDYTD